MLEKEQRPFKELDDDIEDIIYNLSFQDRTWKLGGRFIDPHWRVILHSLKLNYDILLPGLHKTEQSAMNMAKGLTAWLIKKSKDLHPSSIL